VGQIVGTYRALGTGTRIRGSGNRRDPRPTESVVSAKFSTATFAQMIDGSSQLALRIGNQIKGAGKAEQDRQQRPQAARLLRL
jgi:hypothetical protein